MMWRPSTFDKASGKRFGLRLYMPDGHVSEARLHKKFDRRKQLKADEIRKLDAYFKRTFQNPSLQVKARPRKDDSCELYVGDEFLGIVFKDEEDGDYNFSMAILEVDLD